MSSPANPIKTFRLSHSLTQSQLAEMLGVRQGHVSEWEAGKRAVPVYVLKHLECLSRERPIMSKETENEDRT